MAAPLSRASVAEPPRIFSCPGRLPSRCMSSKSGRASTSDSWIRDKAARLAPPPMPRKSASPFANPDAVESLPTPAESDSATSTDADLKDAIKSVCCASHVKDCNDLRDPTPTAAVADLKDAFKGLGRTSRSKNWLLDKLDAPSSVADPKDAIKSGGRASHSNSFADLKDAIKGLGAASHSKNWVPDKLHAAGASSVDYHAGPNFLNAPESGMVPIPKSLLVGAGSGCECKRRTITPSVPMDYYAGPAFLKAHDPG